jgi:formate hydrogenlyase transcriptional activator
MSEMENRIEDDFKDIIGKSKALRRVLDDIETVAPTSSSVLIYGETGTGKELIARSLHNLSSRGANAFVKIELRRHSDRLARERAFRS